MSQMTSTATMMNTNCGSPMVGSMASEYSGTTNRIPRALEPQACYGQCISGQTLKSLQLLQSERVACDQRFLLCSRPAFELSLAPQAVGTIGMLFDVCKLKGTVLRRVCGSAAAVMIRNSTGDVTRFAHVERTVGASQHVDEPHWTTMPSSMAKLSRQNLR